MRIVSNKAQDFCLLAIFGAVALIVGLRPLADFDFGWHLAGGLWILGHQALPQADPFGAEGSRWLCYSWLFEVALAAGYKLGGFRLLQVAQALLVLVLVLCSCVFVRYFSLRSRTAGTPRELLPLLIALILTSQVWYLRPQTISLALFMALVVLAEAKKLKLLLLLPLTVLWANMHVYWISVPAVVFLYSVVLPDTSSSSAERLRGLGKALSVFAAGLLTPYGVELFSGMYHYAFNHRIAYGLITEFNHLSPKQGMYFFATAVVVVGILFALPRRLSSVSKPLLVLWLGSLVAALLQIKYLAFFGVLSAALVAVCGKPSPIAIPAGGTMVGSKLQGIAVAAFVGVCAAFFELPAPLTPRQAELFHVAADLETQRVLGGAPEVVFNDFNDGGWLALVFQRSQPDEPPYQSFLTSIDGRTLVMGESRLAEYEKIAGQHEGWCRALQGWDAKFALLPKNSPLETVLLSEYQDENCGGHWERIATYEFWSTLKYVPNSQHSTA